VTDEIIVCGNGCKDEADASGVPQPRLTEDGRTLCEPCCDRLWKALDHLPDNYVRLPAAIMPGSVERNPETKATKGVHSPPPLRIDPIDLSDERHVMLGGSLPVENVRGVVGILQKWANLIRVQQGSDTNPNPTIASEVSRLMRSYDFLVRQPYAANAYKAVMRAQRDVKDAIGLYRSRSYAACPVLIHDDVSGTAVVCDGNLVPHYGGAKCLACNAVWDQNQIEQLSLMVRGDGGRVTADVAINEVAKGLGLDVTEGQIRDWAHRGHIGRHGRAARGRTVYDLAEIMDYVRARGL
jgi:hypothetical protein